MTIVNDDSRVVNKLEASLTDDARVVIYDRQMLIVQATDLDLPFITCLYVMFLLLFFNNKLVLIPQISSVTYRATCLL